MDKIVHVQSVVDTLCPLPMVLCIIDFDTDLIDYPRFFKYKIGNLPENFLEIGNRIFLEIGNFLQVYLELFGIIGIYGRIFIGI